MILDILKRKRQQNEIFGDSIANMEMEKIPFQGKEWTWANNWEKEVTLR